MSGPALPWGKPAAAASEEIDKDLPTTLNMEFGTARIEVKWELEVEGDEEGVNVLVRRT